MSSSPTSATFAQVAEQLTTGWEQARAAAEQWWDASWEASDQWWAAVTGSPAAGARSAGAPAQARPGTSGGPGKSGCQCGGTDKCRCGKDECRCGKGSGECRCGTSRCRCTDPCACCIPDADVIVRARLGERRIVPFTVRNPTRRELPIGLELGPFHRCGGDDMDIRGRFAEGEALTLGPCEKRTVRLLLAIVGTATQPTEPSDLAPPPPAKPDLGHHDGDVVVVERAEDVTRCSTAYADVRFEGCGRPVRVALVVEPAGCDAVAVRCDCGCC